MPFIRPARFYRFNQVQAAPPPPPPPPPPGGENFITRRSIKNTTGSIVSGDFVTPMIGLQFAAGDLPAGAYPVFKTSAGTTCPATVFNFANWDDGSRRFCAAQVRFQEAIPANGSARLIIYSGGTQPASSSTTLAQVSAINRTIELSGQERLSGVWVSNLGSAITAATDIVKIADGQAGAVWRIGRPFIAASDGSSHPQLYSWHYVSTLQNNGGLAGIRHLGRVMNGFADGTVSLSGRVVECKVKDAGSTTRILLGHVTSETVGSSIALPFYGSFFTAATAATWDFVQGAGSESADAPVRIVMDASSKAYAKTTGMFPPWNITSPAGTATQCEYRPMGMGKVANRALGTTGDAAHIGLFTTWEADHFINQSVTAEANFRKTGLALSGWRNNFRRSSNRMLVPATNVNYGGPLSAEPNWVINLNTGMQNVASAAVTSQWTPWNGEGATDHKPNGAFYPYAITGEPQYLDMVQERAFQSSMITTVVGSPNVMKSSPVSGSVFTNGEQRNITIGGNTYRGITLFLGSNATREGAWASRDVVFAYAASPDSDPYGTSAKDYFNDLISANYTFMSAYNADRGGEWSADGFFGFDNDGLNSSPWNLGYLLNAVSFTSKVTQGRSYVNAFRDHLVRFPVAIASAGFDPASYCAFYDMGRDGDDVRVESASAMLFLLSNGLMSWTSVNSEFRVGPGGTQNNFDFTPTNGDVFAFGSPFDSSKPSNFSNKVKAYVVNASGYNFQLSDDGVSAKPITTNGSVVSVWAKVKNFSPGTSFQSRASFSVGDVGPIVFSAMKYAKAAGSTVSGLDNLISALQVRISAGAGSAAYSADPKWSYTTSYT